MIRRQRSGKRIVVFLAMALALFSSDLVFLCAADSNANVEEHVYNARDSELEKSSVPSLDNLPIPQAPTLFGMISRIAVFLFILTGIGLAVVHYAKKGTISFGQLKPIGTENSLIILETKMLGSRQFLTVVEYNEQKMLLGVSPGRIEQLCFLESVYEEEAREADFSQDRD